MSKPAKSRSVHLTLTPELIALFAELLPVGGGEAPDHAIGWPANTSLRQWKKVVAYYPNGWKLQIDFDRRGEIYNTSASIRMVTKARSA